MSEAYLVSLIIFMGSTTNLIISHHAKDGVMTAIWAGVVIGSGISVFVS